MFDNEDIKEQAYERLLLAGLYRRKASSLSNSNISLGEEACKRLQRYFNSKDLLKKGGENEQKQNDTIDQL